MFVVGVLCNVIVAFAVNRVPVVIIMGGSSNYTQSDTISHRPTGIGTLFTTLACLLIAIIDPDAPYWAYEFPAAVLMYVFYDIILRIPSLIVLQCLWS